MLNLLLPHERDVVGVEGDVQAKLCDEAETLGVGRHSCLLRVLARRARLHEAGHGEGRVVRGYKTLSVGMKIPVKVVNTDSVHGFIDFEYTQGVDPAKEERLARKRAAALALRDRVGETFRAVVSGTSKKATWVRIVPQNFEGRLVRGRRGLKRGGQDGRGSGVGRPGAGFHRLRAGGYRTANRLTLAA
jgi:hypothetical protein